MIKSLGGNRRIGRRSSFRSLSAAASRHDKSGRRRALKQLAPPPTSVAMGTVNYCLRSPGTSAWRLSLAIQWQSTMELSTFSRLPGLGLDFSLPVQGQQTGQYTTPTGRHHQIIRNILDCDQSNYSSCIIFSHILAKLRSIFHESGSDNPFQR